MPIFREHDPTIYKHVDVDNARRRSIEVLDWAKTHFSQKKYAEKGAQLAIRRLPSWQFNAYAAREGAGGELDVIAISEGVSIAFHDDAQTFLEWVEREIGKATYDEIYENIGLKKFRGLPPELGKENALDRMFRLSLVWLYLHEQAHLFQCHAELPGMNPSKRVVEEFYVDEATASEVPAIRHACEISADFEATVQTLQLMIVSDDLKILPGTFWVFIASLTCMFQRFYASGERPLEGIVVGTHPPPSYRLWLMRKLILSWLNIEEVQHRFSVPKDLTIVSKFMDHATVTASMYWNARHKTGQRVDDFLNGAGGMKPIDDQYREKVTQAWFECWPLIQQHHFGWESTVPTPHDFQSLLSD